MLGVVVAACAGYILGFMSVLAIAVISSGNQEDEDDWY